MRKKKDGKEKEIIKRNKRQEENERGTNKQTNKKP